MNQDRLYLQHIRDALQDIASYSSTGREAFLKDRMRQDAILRKLEVIGQAVKNLSESAKSLQPQVPWKQIAGMRDKVIHNLTSPKERKRKLPRRRLSLAVCRS